MRIVHLRYPSQDPAAMLAFYRDVLQLTVLDGQVRIGWSRLQPVAAAGATGSVHLAFNVDPARLDAASQWLQERVPVLHDAEGRSRFALARGWESESVYFAGPDGAVLELIARQRLAAPGQPRGGPFHGNELLCVSEVGLPSADVEAVSRSVGNHFRMRPLAEPGPGFAPLGDDEGLLIVVDRQRRWFPEQRRLPWARGLEVKVQGPPPGLCLYDGEGWSLCSVAAQPR